MSVILEWLSQQVIWVSLICLIGALGYVISAILAKRQRDIAQFTLEREVYHQRMARAWFVAALFLALAGTVFTISVFWIPPVQGNSTPTITPNSGLFTLTPAPSVPDSALAASEALTQVVVSAPEPLGTITPLPEATPVPPEMLQPDCPDPGAQLTFPVAGSDLSGVVEILGTASVNAFSYYRFEVIFPGSNTPNFVAQYDTSVENGVLGSWDISDQTRYPPGTPYRFQLVVVDIYGNTATCTIPVNIVSSETE
ncbi:MAG: hypothetical protein ACP5HS_01365 [Anaerolineae bacterium]